MARKGLVYNLCDDANRPEADNVDMGDHTERNYLREWREFRHMTQEQLAEAIGSSKATIGHLESGERRLSDKWLRKIAPALNTTMGRLLESSPSEIDELNDLFQIVQSVPQGRRHEAIELLKILGGQTIDRESHAPQDAPPKGPRQTGGSKIVPLPRRTKGDTAPEAPRRNSSRINKP